MTEELCCSDCGKHLGWYYYSGPMPWTLCDECFEQEQIELEE